MGQDKACSSFLIISALSRGSVSEGSTSRLFAEDTALAELVRSTNICSTPAS